MSPLIEDAAPDLGTILQALRPPPKWLGSSIPSGTKGMRSAPLVRSSGEGHCAFVPEPLRPHDMVLRASDLAGRMVLHVRAPALELSVNLPRLVIRTQGETAVLWIPGSFPQTINNSLLGMPAAMVATHPLLFGRDYPITAVRYHALEDATAFTFQTGRRHWRGPWPGLLTRVPQDHALRHGVTRPTRSD